MLFSATSEWLHHFCFRFAHVPAYQASCKGSDFCIVNKYLLILSKLFITLVSHQTFFSSKCMLQVFLASFTFDNHNHNLYHGNTPFACANLLPAPNVSIRRDHVHKIKPIFARTNSYQNSPLVLSITEWNSLPSSIVSHTESAPFQAALTVLLEGNPP